jgi:hypothetical protein
MEQNSRSRGASRRKYQSMYQEQEQTSNATPRRAQAHAAARPNPFLGAPGPQPAPPSTVPQRPVAPRLLPRLNPTCSTGDGPGRPHPTPLPTSNPWLATPWRFRGARAAWGTWEKESTINWEGIESSSPEHM